MKRRKRWPIAALVISVTLIPGPSAAVPGPDSVVVIANVNIAESVALARAYAEARQVPDRQVCLLDLPDTIDITLEEHETLLLEGLEACLSDEGLVERIEAAVLIRGVPLRVSIPVPGGERRVSLAAALGLWRSATPEGAPLLGEPPGTEATCGDSPCYAAQWRNPFRFGAFEPGWTDSVGGIEWRPLLVTMLHGRTFDDAAMLIESATAAEELGGADGEFLFMNGADGARGVLDGEYDAVMAALEERGFSNVSRVPFDSNLIGRELAFFVTGTAGLGETIEGNSYHPGSLVDNLTSFGAVPRNFEETGESQVSIARWVALGVAGVHGTTDEPLNSVFPSRSFIVDYADGSTLAESFHRRMPFVYWHNLVLGDAMLAPYAVRPEVEIEGVEEGDSVDDARPITIRGSDLTGEGELEWLALFIDGLEVARVVGGETSLEHCLDVQEGEGVQLLAVAQMADDGTIPGMYRPKGWTSIRIDGAPGVGECLPDEDGGPGDADMPEVDGDVLDDAGADTDVDADGDADEAIEVDSGPDDPAGDGCGCRAAGGGEMVSASVFRWISSFD